MTDHAEREVYAALIGVALKLESELHPIDRLSAAPMVSMALTATWCRLPITEVLTSFRGVMMTLCALRRGVVSPNQRALIHYSAVRWDRAPDDHRARVSRIRDAYTRTRAHN
jgi:hypothetical protein